MPAHDRKWIAPGTYRDGDKIISDIRIGNARHGTQRRVRAIFAGDTPPHTIAKWRYSQKEILIDESPDAPPAGYLAAAIPQFLATLPAGRYKRDSEDIFAHWIASPLAGRPIRQITRLELIEQLSQWIDAGAAVNTCNKRLSRLRRLYHRLFTEDAPNPTDKIRYTAEPKGARRDVPIRIVQLIVDGLPDQGRPVKGKPRPVVSLTKLRLRLMAWTGLQGESLRRVTRDDLDLANGRVWLQPRRKGRGVPGSWVGLLPQAIDAFRAFAAAGLIGKSWSNSSMHGTWTRGVDRAKRAAIALADSTGDQTWLDDVAKIPAACTPYDLRHAFGSEMYRQTGDPLAVKELLQHASLQTTERYTKGAVSARVAAAIAKAGAALAPPPPPPPISSPGVPAAPPIASVVVSGSPAIPAARPRGVLRIVR